MLRFTDDEGIEWEAERTGRCWIEGSETRHGVQFRLANNSSAERTYYGSVSSGVGLDLLPIGALVASLHSALEVAKNLSTVKVPKVH
jgi:hypothetical protein